MIFVKINIYIIAFCWIIELNKASQYSTIGGLAGLVLNEIAINMLNPPFSIPERLSVDLLFYAGGAGIGSLIYLFQIKSELMNKLTGESIGYMINNTTFPFIIGSIGFYLSR